MEKYLPNQIRIHTQRIAQNNDINAMRSAVHEDIEIKCFYEGTATLLIENKTINVKAGDVVVVNPYEFHATIKSGEEVEQGKYHLFMVPLDYLTQSSNELDLRNLLFVQKNSLINHFSGDKYLYDILMRAGKEYAQQEVASDSCIRALMIQFFVHMLRYGLSDRVLSSVQRDTLHSYSLIEPALRHIRDNYSTPITLEKLASLCGVSKHYFCRVFRAVTEKTAMEYLRDYRITVADTLLDNTDKSISEIAELCGFEGANYFCRSYKAVWGMPPGKKRSRSRLVCLGVRDDL